jgi:hypothetical protein
MTKVHVTAKRDFLESITNAKPISALAELVWNGFDAGSEQVQVFLELNQLDGIQAIRIRDHGDGIDHSKVDALFGSLGDSWKKTKGRENGRALHGKNGKGRFKAFALGERVEWNTTYQKDGKWFEYRIIGSAQTLDDFEISDPKEAKSSLNGTEVTINNLKKSFSSLISDTVYLELAKIFAAYLTEYPSLRFEYNGIKVDPKNAQKYSKEYHLGDVEISDGQKVVVSVSIIEWSVPTDRIMHLCDSKGISLYDLPFGQRIRAPGFNFTAYIKSEHFLELDKLNQLGVAELHPDVSVILKVAQNKVKEHFRCRILEGQSEIVEQWKKEHIYPYEENANLNPVEIVERQVFDILAVNVQSYLPSFESSDFRARKFTFRLLAQAIRENPESVQRIIIEVLGLKKEEQDDLAELLEKTQLSSIISSAKIVANRLDFLMGLENLLFDKESKKILLERDQLHKILENEAWLFHEEFSLAGSEQRLEEVLNIHLDKLGKREDDILPVEVSEGKTGRVDIMLHKAIQPRTGEYEYLIVELKRPSKKIDSDVLSQIEKYAIAVASDQRFNGVPARWTFLAVSNELDNYAKRKTNQRNCPKGQIYDDAELNITVWAKSWADIINNTRARLMFVNNQLAYEADRDSAKEYLRKAHAKFIPEYKQENSDS